ncbi:YgaP-like transmembrane domain, partial [Kaarinaea lacus]
MRLNRNMHPIDQVLRVLLGIVLIYIGFFNREMISDALLGSLLGAFGVV